ncbi:MAG: general secretion pathway protein GspK [Bacillota bacterium]
MTSRTPAIFADAALPNGTAGRTVLGRRGTVLIVTLWIIFVLAGLVLVFARSMRVEAYASANHVAAIQASCVERGAEQYVLALIDQQKDAVLELSEDFFAAVPIGDPVSSQPSGGYFWIVRPDYGDVSFPVYGLVDESSKINLNTASQDMLYYLPNMPDDLPPAIVDWRDTNDDITDGGAESEYYLSLPMPYYCKNGSLETLEELLLIKGASRELLYGIDANRNFGTTAVVPSQLGSAHSASTGIRRSSNQQGLSSADTTDLTLQYGLRDYLTVYSAEPNNDASGQRRINIGNGGNRQSLISALNSTFGASRGSQIAARVPNTLNYRDIFQFYTESRMTLEEFRQIADRLTTSNQQVVRGLININTASRTVLYCLGLGDAEISRLISQRNAANVDRTNVAWVIEALTGTTLPSNLGSRITTRAYQYTADIVAVSSNGRSFKHCRIVIDSQNSPPTVVYRRDLTEQGWPLDPSILTSLRSNGSPLGSSPLVRRSAF